MWKVGIVALPLGLALSVAGALIVKIKEGEKTGMEAVSYLASDFEVANLRDAATKIHGLIGERDFETEAGQKAMQRMTSFVEGSLSSLNLGYQVKTDRGQAKEGRIWKNYWIDSDGSEKNGSLIVWTTYSRKEDSASVAALLSLAEWMRGREFERKVRIAFLWDEQGVSSVREGLAQKKDQAIFAVSDLGQGRMSLKRVSYPLEGGTGYDFRGSDGEETQSDWKMTAAWDAFEEQVRELCQEVSELAGERVVFQK